MKLLRFPEVAERTGLARTSIYRLIKLNKFPPPLKQGGGSFWVDDEIKIYIENLMAERFADRASPTKPASS